MNAFYRQRTAFPPTPSEVDPNVVDWYRDKDWVANFTRETNDGPELALLVSGMSCAACTWIIEKFLNEIPEVRSVDINLSQSRVVVGLRHGCDPAKAIETLLTLGYDVRPWRTDERLERMRADNRRDLRRLGVAGLGMMQVGMFAIALHAGDLQGIDADIQQLLRAVSAPLTLFVLFYSGQSFFRNAWQHLRQGALIMDSSVALALVLATLASLWATLAGGGQTYYDSITMFVFFLLLARYAEKRLRDADLIALVRLEDTLPEFVNVYRESAWQRTPRDQVSPGDTLRVSAGDGIAFDGTIVNGTSAVDESIFTGESVPRTVTVGDAVYAGTVNREAAIETTVQSSFRDSRLAALVNDVDRARKEKPTFLLLIDRIAARFVAFVLIAAGLTLGYWLWKDASLALWSALSVLVVACPCALSLATPAAVASVTAWLRRRGVKVKGEFGVLAAANCVDVLIDKTGTLTETTLAVEAISCAENISSAEALALASALQQFSNHPAASSFHGLSAANTVTRVEAVPGAGMRGLWSAPDSKDPIELRLGSASFCAELATIPAPPDKQHYWIGLVAEGVWLAWIGLAEHLRPGAFDCIEALKQQGLRVQILSGDSEERVAAIGKDLDIAYQANLTPADKLSALQTLQQDRRQVLAVGDGLNDAPLLSAADASVAVAGATAIAQAEADFVITEDNLERLSTILTGARSGTRVMKQNLFWAASYNLLGIPFAAMGYIPPWLAALGMSLSSLIVVLNALRLRRMRD